MAYIEFKNTAPIAHNAIKELADGKIFYNRNFGTGIASVPTTLYRADTQHGASISLSNDLESSVDMTQYEETGWVSMGDVRAGYVWLWDDPELGTWEVTVSPSIGFVVPYPIVGNPYYVSFYKYWGDNPEFFDQIEIIFKQEDIYKCYTPWQRNSSDERSWAVEFGCYGCDPVFDPEHPDYLLREDRPLKGQDYYAKFVENGKGYYLDGNDAKLAAGGLVHIIAVCSWMFPWEIGSDGGKHSIYGYVDGRPELHKAEIKEEE